MPDCFVIDARSGQRMTVTATSPDDAAVFQIYSPPFRYTQNDHGVEPQSSALPGAEEGRDASTWSGRLEASGAYLIVVNRTRGGGVYRLHIDKVVARLAPPGQQPDCIATVGGHF
jgi:hypothetical protein